jgi:hypothetical protein
MFNCDCYKEEQNSEANQEGNDLNVKVEESCDPSQQTNNSLPKQTLNPDHERAWPIQQTVINIDVQEEDTIINEKMN